MINNDSIQLGPERLNANNLKKTLEGYIKIHGPQSHSPSSIISRDNEKLTSNFDHFVNLLTFKKFKVPFKMVERSKLVGNIYILKGETFKTS